MSNNEICAWDSDYTKVTPDEKIRLDFGRKQLADGEYFYDDEIDWDNIEVMDLE